MMRFNRTVILLILMVTACVRRDERIEVTRQAAATAAPSQETVEAAPIIALDQTRTAENQAQLDGIDDFSRRLINLMLDSHNRWQTLQAEVIGHWLGDDPQTLQHTILIRQPYLARVGGTDYQAVLGQDDQERQRIDQDSQRLPVTIEDIEPLTISLHPLSSDFAGDNIFPTGLAQRGGRYELVAEETILDRAVWVVDWYDVRNNRGRRNRFWIDQETGLILKSWGYAEGEKYAEIEFISLVLDEPIPDEVFQEGRTVTSRIITSYGEHEPISGAMLQIEPGGEFVAETDADGRFTLTNLPFTEITVYANHLEFTIPAGDEPWLDLGDIEYPLIHPPVYQLTDYPPSSTPYRIESGGFWLVHTPEGQLYAFAPVAPDYADHVSVDECRYAWSEAAGRFIDPCSGDEWEVNGRFNRQHSSEQWSRRDLDQYVLSVQDGVIYVYLDRLIPGLPIDQPPPMLDATTPTPPTTAQFTETEEIITRLETLQMQYEQMLGNHEGWLYARRTAYSHLSLRNSQEPATFLGLDDTWVWEEWFEVVDGQIHRKVIHILDENEGIWQRQLNADGWVVLVLPLETLEGRVKRFNEPTISANALLGPHWLLQQLPQITRLDVTAGEADGLFHVTLYETHEPPIEGVSVDTPIAASRYDYVFDTASGLLWQQSGEMLLTTGEWQLAYKDTFTQFDLLTQLPASAAYTLQEGTALLAAER